MTLAYGSALQSRSRAVTVVICFSIFAISCSDENLQEPVVAVRPAKLIEVSNSSSLRSFDLPAVIEATESTELTFQVGGLLQELVVVEGQTVDIDELIARLDQRSFQSDLVAAQAEYDRADTEHQRALKLATDGIIARSALEQRRAQRDIAWTGLDRARKAFDDTVLKSPFEGVIGEIHGKAFQNVQPHEPIVTLHTTGAAVAVVQVPATLIAAVGRLDFENTRVVLDAARDLHISVEFLSISTVADPETRTFKTRFAFTPPEGSLVLPGMTGSLQSSFKVTDKDDAGNRITIPLDAILSDGARRYVWVVDIESMTVSRRPVILATGIGDMLEVVGGLEVGETIVGAGASYLHEGMKIRRYE